MSAALLQHPRRRSTDAVPDLRLVWLTRRAIALSIIVTAALIVIAGGAAASIFQKISDRRTFNEVQAHGERAAGDVLAPLITESFLDHDAPALAAMDRASAGLKQYGGASQITISAADGRVVWSDESESLGAMLGLEELPAAGSSLVTVDAITDADAGAKSPGFVEVHSGIASMRGTVMIVTVSYPYSSLGSQGNNMIDAILPVLGGAALLLAVVLVPLGIAIPRQSRRQRRERDRLLERLIASSDAERRRIAGEVHDGAVQDLVGVSFALGAVANELPAPLDNRVRDLAATTRTTVSGLRSLLNSIYPVQVPPQGWLAGVDDLIDGLRGAGLDVVTDVSRDRYSPLNELLMLRVAREALRNVAAHAEARSVTITVKRRGELVCLAIADDGVGFEHVTVRAQREAGHFGLQLVRDLACEMGATLTVESTPGSGTVVGLELKEDE